MVCAAIEKTIMEMFLPKPTTNTWKEVAQRFWEKWNFPNCPLDGKLVVIQAPPGVNILITKTFFIVLLALVDADYDFRCIPVEDFGRTSDRGVYASSDLGKVMVKNMLHVPPNNCCPVQLLAL